MPNWGELSEGQRLAAAQDYYQRHLSFPDIHRKYSISNPSTAERKIRKYRGVILDESHDDAPPPAMPIPQPQVSDVLASFMQYQAALQRWRSERVRDELDITLCDGKPIGVAFPADRHIGDEGTDHELQLEHARLLGDADGMHVMEGGDGVSNYINPKIKDASRSDLPPDAQYAVYAQILRMTQPMCVSHGNHDGWSTKFAGIDPLADLAGDVPTVCTADGAEIRLHVGSQMYTIYRQHKARYNSAFNLTHAVKRLWDMGPCNFDVGVCDHQHMPSVEPFYKHGKLKIAVRAGTYKVYDGWARSQGFYGARVGVPVVFFWPDTWRMQVWPQIDDVAGAVEYLAWLRR